MSMMLPCLDPDSQTPAATVLPDDWLSEDAFAALAKEANVRHWIDALIAAGAVEDALRLVTHVLPRKYALAWACEVLRSMISVSTSETTEIERVGIALAERWLKDPSEANRRAALEFAERGGFKRPGEWIAAATGWAEGSLAPDGPDFAPVPPPDGLTGEAACAAILTAGWQVPSKRTDLLQAAALLALDRFGTTEQTP